MSNTRLQDSTNQESRTQESKAPELAILLAAGRGKRLRPHTDTIPKPLLPVNGRPTLDLLFESLCNAGIKQVILVTHHLAGQIDKYLEQQDWPLQVSSVFQPQMLGTGHALLTALPEDNDAPVMVSATDYLLHAGFYRELVEFHAEHDADISVSLKAVPADELSKRSSVRFDENGAVTEVVEKPAEGSAPSAYAANLLYILPPHFRASLASIKASERGEIELQDAVNQHLANGQTARGLLQKTPQEWQAGLLDGKFEN